MPIQKFKVMTTEHAKNSLTTVKLKKLLHLTHTVNNHPTPIYTVSYIVLYNTYNIL